MYKLLLIILALVSLGVIFIINKSTQSDMGKYPIMGNLTAQREIKDDKDLTN